MDFASIEDNDSTVIVENDIEYDIQNGKIDVEVSVVDEENNEIIDESDAEANVFLDENRVVGVFEYDGEM